jgi:NAD(P)H dehydrogenase (quinone)
MKILVILGHPDKKSFNHAIAASVVAALEKNRHAVMFHDLYKEKFDPVLPVPEAAHDAPLLPAVRRHCRDLAAADGIVVVHPNWWGQPPAIVKGWIDRVLRPGVAYRFLESDGGEGVPLGLLKAKCAVVFNTSNTPAKRERETFCDPLEGLWKTCIFDLCGVKRFYRKMFGVMVISTPRQRQEWLKQVERITERYFPSHAGRCAESKRPVWKNLF